MPCEATEKITTGTPGLDDVLHGGFPEGYPTIISGGPGTGKTILALQFLAASDTGLYIGFEEREHQLRTNANALGIDLSTVSILDLSAPGDRFFDNDSYTVFTSDEVEGRDLLDEIATELDTNDIDRLVIDPLSELRALLPDDFQFRRNISSLFNALTDRDITTLCTAQADDQPTEQDLKFLANTIIDLQRTTNHRTLEVTKYRGSEFASGQHTYRIHPDTGGRVYPKLVPGDHNADHDRTQLRSDVDSLDALLGGGLERGSVTVISGPSGVGKTTTGSHFLQAAAARGDHALVYLFEELAADYRYRATQLGIGLDQYVEAGTLDIEEVEALTRSPDEFAHHVREAVETQDVELIMLDGIAGYRQGLRGDDTTAELTRELHALCRYLKRMGVTVILIEEVNSITGDFSPTTNDISYLADNIVFLRYLETNGRLQKAIGVLKKRYSDFEDTLRELTIDTDGLQVGDPLTGYRGLLSGTAVEGPSPHSDHNS